MTHQKSVRLSGARGSGGEEGFSLVELMIALMVGLIVSGAIFGLIATGQNAFRREPEVTERQQNIRVAMDLMQRDIAAAGLGMNGFIQAFTDGLNNAGASDPVVFPAVIEPAASSSESTDYLEIRGNDGACGMVQSQTGNESDGANVNLAPVPDCYPEPSILFVNYREGQTEFGIGWEIHAQQRKINFPPGKQAGLNDNHLSFFPGPNQLTPISVGLMQILRYEIAPDPTDGAPSLYRSLTGGIDTTAGAYVDPPSAAGGWQLVARGIEDLQVQYLNGNGIWLDQPGPVSPCAGGIGSCTPAEYNTIVRQVRVTLSARALAIKLAGETQPIPAAVSAIRGQLTSVSVPRAALQALATAASPPPWQQ